MCIEIISRIRDIYGPVFKEIKKCLCSFSSGFDLRSMDVCRLKQDSRGKNEHFLEVS